MQENFTIEDAKPTDVETFRTMIRDAWLEIYPNEEYGITPGDVTGIDWYESAGLEKRRKEILEETDKRHIWVLKNDKNETVGFCKALKFEDSGEIDAIYVLPGLKGKGLGKKLMEKALEWLGAEMDIKLKVVAYNTRAIEFYKKFGFKETTNKVDYQGTKLANGKEVPRIEMVRSR